jgi:hypothetical protein
MDFLFEFIEFIKVRKKYWLLPIIIITFLLGSLLFISEGSVMAPFIYTIF